MAATATSTGTANWSTDGTWAISGIGTASGAGGVLASGVLTPTVSPGWTIGALVGRRMKLAATWYDISANTATTATITSPPADATYAYLLGGAPLATDNVVIATGHSVADDVARIPATSGVLLSLIAQGTGKLTVVLSTDRELHATTITAPLYVTGTTDGKYFDIHVATATAIATGEAYFLYPSTTKGTCRLHVTTLAGASAANTPGIIAGYGAIEIDGAVEGTPGAFTIIGGAGLRSPGILVYDGTKNVSITGTATYPCTLTGHATNPNGPAVSCYSTACTPNVTLTHCNLVDSATCAAWSGKPPIWNITDSANYIQFPAVALTTTPNAARPSQAMRFYLPPQPGNVKLDLAGGYENGANPPSYTTLGTRVDCPVGKAVTSSGNYGDPDAWKVGTRTDAAVGDVKAGVKYGDPDSQLTGTLAGGGVRRGGALRGA